MQSTDDQPCDLLPWDTAFFGFRIARARDQVLTAASLAGITDWCKRESIRCLYFLAKSDDAETVALAESNQFHLADLRLTWNCVPTGISTGYLGDTRLATSADLSALIDLARVSHTNTRFYFDDHFPRQLCDDLYETWIRSSVGGMAGAVIVVDCDGLPCGYCTCQLNADKISGSIGLIAVAGWRQGQGFGRMLVTAAQRWFIDQGVRQISVVTQGRNVAAQRMYARCGFVPATVELYYHRWFEVGSDNT